MTQRPQNRCKECAYTWFPRGRDRSLKCPNCGAGAVGIVIPKFVPAPASHGLGVVATLLVLGGVIAFVLLLASSDRPSKEGRPPPSPGTPRQPNSDPRQPQAPETELDERPRVPALVREAGGADDPTAPPTQSEPQAASAPSPEDERQQAIKKAKRELNLVSNYMLNDRLDLALEHLDKAEATSEDQEVRAEAARLRAEIDRRLSAKRGRR